MENFRTFRDTAGATRSDSVLTMKRDLGKVIVVSLLTVFLHGGAGDLSAQTASGGEGAFKKLLVLKFDSSKDGSLTGLEKRKAVDFLNQQDVNQDGQISLEERTLAVTALNEMRDLGKKVVTERMTPENRNEAKRDAVWGEFIKKLPHSTEGRTFTKMPGDAGFKREGDTFIDSTKFKGVAPGSDRVTSAELNKRLANLTSTRKRRQQRMGIKPLKKETKPALALKKKDYYAGTTILVAGEDHTVVPQGAVLSLPPKLANMVVEKPQGTLMIWPEFIKKHYRLITTKEVSYETAKGEDPISEKEKKAFSIGGKVVIAVYKKNPIEVKEPPVEEEEVVKGAVASDTRQQR